MTGMSSFCMQVLVLLMFYYAFVPLLRYYYYYTILVSFKKVTHSDPVVTVTLFLFSIIWVQVQWKYVGHLCYLASQ